MFSLLVVFLGFVLLSISARANDTFPGTALSGNSGSFTSSNTTATGETNEPATFGAGSLNTIWYNWTAPATGTFTAQTCSATITTFDTTLKAYTGTSVAAASLTTMASNDDACANTTPNAYASLITFPVTSGVNYKIQVDGYASATGTYLFTYSFTPPTVVIANTTNGVEAVAPTNGLMTVTQSGISATNTVISYSVGGTATAGSDYGALSGSVTILAGATTATISIPVLDDLIVESSESVIVTLTGITSGVSTLGATVVATNTITSNDTATVSIANTSNGVETGPTPGVLTLTQTAASATNTVIAYSIGGTATAGSDYTALSGTVTIPAGSTTATISVPVLEDATAEATETVIVTLTSVSSGLASLAAPLSATNSILDNDGAFVSIAGTTNGNEAGLVAGVFTITQTATRVADTVIAYSVTGSAASGTDFSTLSGTVTIVTGATTATISIPVLQDLIVEGTENVTITLTSVTSGLASLGSPLVASVSIADDDVSTVSIASISNAAEPATSGTFRLTLTKASATATTVSYTVTGTATSGTDFTSIGTSVVVPANTLTFDISVAPLNDLIVEGSETVITTLTAATSNGLITASGNATNTIVDDDVATLTLGVPAVNEATGTATFAVTLNVATASGFTIAAATSSGTATQGSDFAAATPTLTFVGTAGESQNISVPITDDALVEGSEAFNITLSALSNSFGGALTFTSGAQSRTIADNDVSTVSIASITNAAEPATSGTLRLTLTKASATATTVSYTVAGTATAGTDYTSIGTSVVVPANTLTFDISIVPTDDFIVESAETLIVTLTSATSNVLITASGNATNTIADNDVASLVLGAPAINEAAGTAVYPVTLSAATSSGFTIAAATSSGTATQGTDFTAATPTLTFAGTVSEVQTISVPITEDVLVEGSEAFNITLSALSNSFGGALTFTSGAQSRTIADNDVSTVSIASITNAAEPATSGTLRLTLTKASATTTTVSYTVAGTASSGTDYTSIGVSVVVPANALTFDIDVTPLNDLIVEGSETVIVTLTATTSNTLISASGAATNTIADDESATVSISNTTNGAEAVVPTNGVMTVMQTAVSATDTVLTYTVAGTATAGSDYTALSGSVTILAGATSATITIPVLDNLVVEPNETVIITLSSATNNALITASGNATNTIADNDVASFTISKAVNLSNIAAPVSLNYTITVSSTGNVPLTAPVLTDALSNGASLTLTSGPTLTSGDVAPLGTLDSGETWIYSASYTVTQANINSGSTIANTATFDSAETSASTSNTVTTTITQNPHLKITKNVNTNGPVPAGTILTYTYEIENDGNITMTNVSVNDTHNGYVPLVGPSNEVLTDMAPATDSTDSSQSGPADGVWDTLAPGDIVTFSATYEVQQHDVDYLQ